MLSLGRWPGSKRMVYHLRDILVVDMVVTQTGCTSGYQENVYTRHTGGRARKVLSTAGVPKLIILRKRW